MNVDLSEYEHPSWMTVAGTAVSYGLILTVMFVALFVIPFAIFLAL